MHRAGSLLLVALLPAAAAAQNAVQGDPARFRHEIAVRTERTARFFALWQEAPAARREQTVRVLRELRSPGSAAGSRPTLPLLALATRVLAGDDPAAVADDALQRFADSLDLQVVPGAFEPATEGRGEALTVRVYRLFDDPPAPDVELALEWLAPDGERVSARREPFRGAAFRAPGFPMFVRAPLSAPATWELIPVVHRDGREARGAPVVVECIDGLRLRAQELAATAGGSPSAVFVWNALRRRGLRHPEVERMSDLLPAIEGDRPGPRAFLRPLALPPGAKNPDRIYGWGGFPTPDCGRALVFFTPADDGLESPFAGPVGAAWLRFARERRIGLFVLRLGAADAAVLGGALRLVAQSLRPERELILVARGSAIWMFQMMLLAEPAAESIDALVLTSPSAATARRLPAVPTLVVSPELPAGEVPEHVTHVRAGETCLLAEPALPRLVGNWLDGRDRD